MTTYTGTYDLATLLAARYSSAAQYGLDTITKILADDLATHNAIAAVGQAIGFVVRLIRAG